MKGLFPVVGFDEARGRVMIVMSFPTLDVWWETSDEFAAGHGCKFEEVGTWQLVEFGWVYPN